ncbi:unnamed protein product [Parajaminaea phylloscopi]
MRKQLDPRIPALIRNNVHLNHRSFFVLVGDRARDQVVNLHFLLSQSRHSARPNVLWCYKKDLGFTTHRKKREQKIKRDIKRGIREKGDSQDPFELFVGVTDIRYCYYKDTPKILGRTFGMLVLQDFEAMTPNLLARTIETVEGGGIVVLMLRTMSSLRQLYSMGMDVHSKYRSSMDPSDPVARFNERFLLSLGSNSDTLLLDDELNVLPLSKGKDIQAIDGASSQKAAVSDSARQLEELKDDVGQDAGVAEIVKCCKTLDQARCLLSILDIVSSSSLSATVSLTAARGRGKSALLGLAIAVAVAHGYSNIFVTSPSPENLKTLFEFLFKGLSTLGYEETSDWSLQRGSGDWKDIVVRVNVFKNSRQTVQYIDPADSHVLGQAELVVIDEAAAIPLPLVRKLLGPYLVFLSSTINGYEGTGRSLSLKLIQQLRESSQAAAPAASTKEDDDVLTVPSAKSKDKGSMSTSSISTGISSSIRSLKELTLDEPIRYSPGDKIESWLNQLLCLDATLYKPKSKPAHPSSCSLYLVNRDALFSYHPASEVFLQKMMALYVSSHYKNSPNDLQLMSDAPGHRLFVLLAPQEPGSTSLPEPLAVLQVALEGNIARQSVLNSLSRGERSSGDLIPWTLSQQFQDFDFASLNGVRVVRLAVHPHYAQSGYGSRALECMRQYFAGEMLDADAVAERESKAASAQEESFMDAAKQAKSSSSSALQAETIALRDAARMPALLQRLSDLRPESVDWFGVSFGLTPNLFRFWKKAHYVPLYVRQVPNDLTGEYTSIMLRSVHGASSSATSDLPWLGEFARDFRKRFAALLGFRFREFSAVSALSIFEAATSAIAEGPGASEDGDAVATRSATPALNGSELRQTITPFDLKRLEAFGNNMVEYSIVLDLLPTLASLYFAGRIRASDEDDSATGAVPSGTEDELPVLKLTALQAALLLSVGLQRKDPSDVIANEFGIPVQQGVALLAKAVRRIVQCLRRVERRDLSERDEPTDEPSADSVVGGAGRLSKVTTRGIEAELEAAGKKVVAAQREADAAAAEVSELGGGALPAAADNSGRDWSEAERRVQALAKAKEQGLSEEELSRLSTVVRVRKDAEDDADSAATSSPANKKKRKDSSNGRGGARKPKRTK